MDEEGPHPKVFVVFHRTPRAPGPHHSSSPLLHDIGEWMDLAWHAQKLAGTGDFVWDSESKNW